MTANEISSWLESAVNDMAEGNSWEEIETMADDMYNDPELVGDLIGGRIFDSCQNLKTNTDKIKAKNICLELIGMATYHDALREAAIKFIENHLKDIENV